MIDHHTHQVKIDVNHYHISDQNFTIKAVRSCIIRLTAKKIKMIQHSIIINYHSEIYDYQELIPLMVPLNMDFI